MLDDEELLTPLPETKRRPSWGITSARVAVGEPDAAARRLLVAKLLDEGYEVYEADTGPRLLDLVWSAPPDQGIDLVLVDQAMPFVDGLEVVRRLRAGEQHGPVLLTARAPAPLLSAHARRLGATLVSKPFALEVVSTLVRAALLLRPPRRARPRFRVAP